MQYTLIIVSLITIAFSLTALWRIDQFPEGSNLLPTKTRKRAFLILLAYLLTVLVIMLGLAIRVGTDISGLTNPLFEAPYRNNGLMLAFSTILMLITTIGSAAVVIQYLALIPTLYIAGWNLYCVILCEMSLARGCHVRKRYRAGLSATLTAAAVILLLCIIF